MEMIRGINFAPFPRRGVLASAEAKESLRAMAEQLHADTVILTPSGLQRDAHSTRIDWEGPGTPTDEELTDAIRLIHGMGMRVILKPTVNCMDGTWRAYISFIEPDSPAEAHWSDWFRSHTEFQCHYARIAEAERCEMFLTGCEMVMSDHRDADWRALIAAVRACYSGPVGYNCDKYREDQVTWWDCVDVISSSGYYPTGSWEKQLDRIEAVLERYRKPFFFAELGCMAISGAADLPNEWKLQGSEDYAQQAAWYREMFGATLRRSWVRGYAFWDWGGSLSAPANGGRTYHLYGTEAGSLVGRVYEGKGL